MKTISNPPEATSLFESSRSQGGYTLASALADLIDNSISANATLIEIETHFANSKLVSVSITDNGDGMTESELISAMRPASKSPREVRGKGDLGRFGWGLKAASFSQARKLTVVSKKLGGVTACCWNIDDAADWNMRVATGEEAEGLTGTAPKSESWTQVIWENCDRLTAADSLSSDDVAIVFSEAATEVGLTFHRYLSPLRRLLDIDRDLVPIDIKIDGELVVAQDPLMLGHTSTRLLIDTGYAVKKWTKPDGSAARYNYAPVQVPHFGTLSKEDKASHFNTTDYLAAQGFYVYRGKRLIIPGDWLGARVRSAYAQLTRILVDIENTDDEDFKITIDKTRAQLPQVLKPVFQSIADSAVETSTKTVSRVGRMVTRRGDQATRGIWKLTSHSAAKTSPIRVDREHPLIQALSAEFRSVDAFISLVEASLPVGVMERQIRNDETVSVAAMDQTELEQDLEKILAMLAEQKLNKSEAIEILNSCEKYAEFESQIRSAAEVVFGDEE